MTEFLARAVVELDASDQWDDGDAPPLRLPAAMGPFRLNSSPNADLYFGHIYGIEPEQLAHIRVDYDYPISAFYVDTTLEVARQSELLARADERFDRFELLLRLLQPGDVSIRRYSFPIGEGTGDGYSYWGFGDPVKSKVATRYGRSAYRLDDAVLDLLVDFLDLYWETLDNLNPGLRLGLHRFSSSYERRELADRLIDLVIALEALFNDGDQGSITFKIATRSGAWLHRPGSERLALFEFIKKAYGYRSSAVHGRGRKELTADDLDYLEQVVRACLIKFLNYQTVHGQSPAPKELDEMMMEGRFCKL